MEISSSDSVILMIVDKDQHLKSAQRISTIKIYKAT